MRVHVLRVSQMGIDLGALSMAYALAFSVRFDWNIPTEMLGRLLLTAPYIVLGEYALLWATGVPRFSWRFIGIREISAIFVSTLIGSSCLMVIRALLGPLALSIPVLRHGVIPWGVLAINCVFAFLAVGGVRALRRYLAEHRESQQMARSADGRLAIPTMLVGAGRGGMLLAKELTGRPDLGIQAVGFLDDDPAKEGLMLGGLRVLGSTARMAELCRRRGAKQVLITMASESGDTIRRITQLAEEAGLPARIIPGLYEIATGRVNITRTRPVAIQDLLRRAPIELDDDTIAAHLKGQVVLVTGAGGSIGSEICRQVVRFHPAEVVLLERSENALFEIHRELRREAGTALPVVPRLADVTDQHRVEEVFRERRPQVVFHAAAHKHVPMMEWNPGEAVKNNVHGTRTVADVADAFGVSSFVMISTDKAVNPTSVMGATKRVAEMYVQALSNRSATRFVTVRFGNVLGSAGSVIPIFKEQIAHGGPVTVTHPDMKRYFMTIPEACQLVLQAGSMGDGGEIFILDMGEPVKIVDLARDLIRLSGFKPGEDVRIEFVGARPGEKLYEELALDTERADKTRHEKIFVGRRGGPPWVELMHRMRTLDAALDGDDEPALVAALQRCVPEFHRAGFGGATASPPTSRPEPETSSVGRVRTARLLASGAD